MADEAAQNLVKVYSGPLTERPSAGVDGRFWVTDTGAVYEDDGSTWSLVDREYKSVSTERGVFESLTYDYSDQFPLWPRQPESSGPPAFEPHHAADNPVLRVEDVDDFSGGDFVADPFVVVEDGQFHMFFEIGDRDGNNYAIGHATSPDGVAWSYDQVVIGPRDGVAGSLNYSYPFKWAGEWYILDYMNGGSLKWWKADPFPTGWTDVSTYSWPAHTRNEDPTPFYQNSDRVAWGDSTDRFWIFSHDGQANEKYLYYADTFSDLLNGNLTEHPNSPVETGLLARNAGYPIVGEDWIDLPCRGQSNGVERTYMIRVTDLTPSSYQSYELATSPLLEGTGRGWNAQSMHHCSPIIPDDGPGFAVVDGRGGSNTDYSIGIYGLSSTGQKRANTAVDNLRERTIPYHTFFDSTDGMGVTTSGSGDVILYENRVELYTGSTSGSVAQLTDQLRRNTCYVLPTWEADRSLMFGVSIETSVSNRTDYFCTGGVPSGNEGVGIKVDSGNIYGVVHDGTSETTALIRSASLAESNRVRVEYMAGDRVEFFVDENADDAERATITSGLPTGTTASEVFVNLHTENTAAEEKRAWLSDWRCVQHKRVNG